MTSTPHIEIHGGVGTIGGTKVAVCEGGYRVLFDFGVTYNPGGELWGTKVAARTGAAARLRDLVTLGYAPALDGLYRPESAATLGLQPGDGKTHVFISHLHLDHMALLDLLAGNVPVWMHDQSLKLFRAVAETGEQPPVPTGARGFQWGQPIAVGPMTVTPVAVDHDVEGASGLLIKTSAGTVVYTGDLRSHGAHPEHSASFIAAARASDPKVLIIEGTRLGEEERAPDRPPSLSEPEVPGRIAEVVSGCSGLALITLYPRNTLRLETITAAMPGVGRKMLFSPEMAHVFRSMGGDLSQAGLYLRAKDKEALAAGQAAAWLTDLLATGVQTVDADGVRREPTKYLLQLFYWDLPELVDIQPPPGSIFIHSNGEPLGRFDPGFEIFTRWLDRFGLELVMVPSTGHAPAQDLAAVVEGVRPAILMPIHSRAPELLEVAGIERVLPEMGGIYAVATGKRIG